MKKLYRKGTVHPTPPAVSDQLLSFLPAAIVTLTVALSPEEREVLAYLISCSSANVTNHQHKKSPVAAASGGSKGGSASDHRHHQPCFKCYCFRCYTSYWVKWDSSPNRQLIHEIIDAFEDSLVKESKKEKSKKERRKSKNSKGSNSLEILDEVKKSTEMSLTQEDSNFAESNSAADRGAVADAVGESGGDEDSDEEVEFEKGSMRRFVSFLGERVWSVWG